MSDALITEVESRIFDKENTEEDFKLLIKEYPYYPNVWIAYATYCQNTLNDAKKAKRILLSVCSSLRALEIWVRLLELEVSTSNDNFAKYSLLQAAVDDVGWDPRSLPLWDSFFALFVSLHNQTVKFLAVSHNILPTHAVGLHSTSSTAPLASLEATRVSFHERHLPVNDDISSFFTTVDTADLLSSKAQAVREALLRHPLRHEQVIEDSKAVVNEQKLRELSAKGGLNLEVFQQYLRRFALTPFLSGPATLWRSIAGVLPEAIKSQLETCANNIQRMAPIIFQSISPSIFCRPSSALTPELDVTTLGYWESLLAKEAQDCWGIAQVDPQLWNCRMQFLYHTGCRNLRYIPNIWFERAQFHFKQGLVQEGLNLLELIVNENVILGDSLPIVLADAWELLADDLEKSVSLLANSLTGSQCFVSAAPKASAALAYSALLKNARLRGMQTWTNGVRALLEDPTAEHSLTEELFCALISFAYYEDQDASLITELTQRGLSKYPSSVPLRLLLSMPITSYPKPPDYEQAFLSLATSSNTILITSEALAIVKRACLHYHMYGTSTLLYKKWIGRLQVLASKEIGTLFDVTASPPMTVSHLFTNEYQESFRHYDTYCLDLSDAGLLPYLCPPASQHRVIMPPGSLPAEQIALLVRGSQRVKQILEIIQNIVPSGEHEMLEVANAADKTFIFRKVLLRAVEKARGRRLINQQHADQLRTMQEDPALHRVLQRWFETTS